MSGGRSWTTSEVKILHDMRARRIKTADIAKVLGRSEYAIYSYLRYVPASPEHGPGTRSAPPRPKLPKREPQIIAWTPSEIELLRQLAAEGATAPDAAKILGKTYSGVRTKASREGVRFRHAGTDRYRLEHEGNRFKANAVVGSAMLLDALLAMAA
jgi:hypothetical protein